MCTFCRRSSSNNTSPEEQNPDIVATTVLHCCPLNFFVIITDIRRGDTEIEKVPLSDKLDDLNDGISIPQA